MRTSGDWTYGIGAGLALLTTALLLWINAAVWLIGSGEHPANLLHLAVIAVGFLGAVASRFRAGGLSQSRVCAAALQTAIGILAVARGWGQGSDNWSWSVIVLGILFALIWLASAYLFRRAAIASSSR